MKCLKCGSENTNKKGERVSYQLYYCNDCHKNFKIPKKKRKNILKEIKYSIINSDEKYLWLIFAIFSAIYFLTYINANNELIVDAFHDDALYLWLGQNISLGNWLGNYMQLTLAKMPSYAMFIAFSIKTGIPYLWLFSICHIIAVTFLLIKSKYLFTNAKWLLIILGILLLFNPILALYLRIYRFQLPAICFIVFIATLISLFNPSTKQTHWVVKMLDGLIISIAWGLLWFSREEYLYYVGCLLIALIAFFIVKRNILYPIRNLLPILYGIIGVIAFWLFISTMNYKYYDRFVVCERTSAPFTDVISTFNSIDDPDFPKNISGSAASREKIIKIGQNVPMFRPMAENLISNAMAYRGVYLDTEKLIFVNEPENVMTVSHFEWAWIAAANKTGYYKNASTLAQYYTNLNVQLKKAIDDGKLSTSKDDLFTIGPYTLSKNDISAIIRLIPKNYNKLFPKPGEIYKSYRNILVRTSNITDDKTAKLWSDKLKINYIKKGDNQAYKKAVNSFSNKFWNFTASIFAYTGMPLIHLASILSFLAFIVAIKRKQWVFAAILIVTSSTYIAHYLLIAVVSVMISYDDAQIAYFLPTYGTMLINAFLAISVIFNLQKKPILNKHFT